MTVKNFDQIFYLQKISWDSGNLKGLLKTLITAYLNDEIPFPEVKYKLLLLLCTIVEDDHLRGRYDCDRLVDFIRSLPCELMTEVVPFQVVRALSLLSRQRSKVFLNSFAYCAVDIVKNLEKLTIIHGPNKCEVASTVASLFYWLEDADVLIRVLSAAKETPMEKWKADLITQMISQRIDKLRS